MSRRCESNRQDDELQERLASQRRITSRHAACCCDGSTQRRTIELTCRAAPWRRAPPSPGARCAGAGGTPSAPCRPRAPPSRASPPAGPAAAAAAHPAVLGQAEVSAGLSFILGLRCITRRQRLASRVTHCAGQRAPVCFKCAALSTTGHTAHDSTSSHSCTTELQGLTQRLHDQMPASCTKSHMCAALRLVVTLAIQCMLHGAYQDPQCSA